MKLNNGLTTCNNKSVSFVNKGYQILFTVILLFFIVAFATLLLALWEKVPIIIRILWLFLSSIIAIGSLITPFCGLYIRKNNAIFFIPDFRIKKYSLDQVERISINFNEWENEKYSASIKILCVDGRMFKKDYSKQFRNMRNKWFSMLIYTIGQKKTNRIVNMLSEMSFVVITIIDKNGNIVYQHRKNA